MAAGCFGQTAWQGKGPRGLCKQIESIRKECFHCNKQNGSSRRRRRRRRVLIWALSGLAANMILKDKATVKPKGMPHLNFGYQFKGSKQQIFS
jgi:hypothetical protein